MRIKHNISQSIFQMSRADQTQESKSMDLTISSPRKVHLISLGCARNRVDAEVMLGGMIDGGWEITDQPTEANAVVVNTCGFIGPAKEESIDTILEVAEYKKAKPEMKLVVTGCLSQRYKTQLSNGMPEVDFFLGTDEFPKIADYLDEPLPKGSVKAKRTNYLYSGELPKKNTLSKGSAYVKVSEGCQHNCAFCIIPAIRGRLRSRPVSSVLAEAKKLAGEGVQELNLIAQDLAAYGRDTGTADLLELLRELVKIEGINWIRLLYMYPENISADFIEFFASEPKLVKYLDIPVQHGSDSVLDRMDRNVTQAEMKETISMLRARIPEVAIRTSVMVGFPGETESEFEDLMGFVKSVKFDHLGCFTYSQEEGTVAGRMVDQIDEETKLYRQNAVMEQQRNISRDRLSGYVGQIVPVLVNGLSEETDLLGEGRAAFQAPEVDGVVYINDGKLEPSRIQNIEIVETHDYDLVGRVVAAKY